MNVELDNTFLSALSAIIETNFTLETINLKDNSFTSDALVEFCQAMSENVSVKTVDLRGQHSPVLGTAEDDAIAGLKKNQTVQSLQIDFKSDKAKKDVADILVRNKKSPKYITDIDKKMLEHLEHMALRAEDHAAHLETEARFLDVTDANDWAYLYELNTLAQTYKLYDTDAASDDGDIPKGFAPVTHSPKKKPVKGITVKFTADGAFLDDEFIGAYLMDDEEGRGLTFAFQSQALLFKRFPIGDSQRRFISETFADVLLNHPRSKELTHINMANCACGDEWLEHLCNRCLEDPKLLPHLSSLNMETNFVGQAGIVALSKCIASPKTWRYLQSVKLENQRQLISSKAELALAKAMCVNRSVIRLSLRVRNMWERDQCNKFVSRNIDFLRQARIAHALKTGTHVERSRNKIEQLFDKIAANDASITDVDLVGDQLYTALSMDEVIVRRNRSMGQSNPITTQPSLCLVVYRNLLKRLPPTPT
jgi:hypothetical protein